MSIYTHTHHIIPRHAGGTDDPSNLVELTIEDHAIAHEVRYRIYGDDRDRVAALMIRGQISNYDAFIEMVSRPKSEEWKKAKSEAMKGENNPMWGKTISDEHKEAVRVANSVPKPYVSENMKKRHAEGKSYTFDKEDSSRAGKAAQAKKPKWFTDGKENKYCPIGEEPDGFWRGRTTGWKTHP